MTKIFDELGSFQIKLNFKYTIIYYYRLGLKVNSLI